PARTALPTPVGVAEMSPDAIRAAIARSMPLLQQVDVNFIKLTGCVSCHHNSLVAMAMATARANGFAVDEAIAARQKATIGAYLESWRHGAAADKFLRSCQTAHHLPPLTAAPRGDPPHAARPPPDRLQKGARTRDARP